MATKDAIGTGGFWCMFCSVKFLCIFLLKKIYFIDYAITVVPLFLPFMPRCPAPSFPPASLPLSSCPGVVHVSPFAFSFSIFTLTVAP